MTVRQAVRHGGLALALALASLATAGRAAASPPSKILQELACTSCHLESSSKRFLYDSWEAFRTADDAAPFLSKAFVDAHFGFHAKTLTGQAELAVRWKRGVHTVSGGDYGAGDRSDCSACSRELQTSACGSP